MYRTVRVTVLLRYVTLALLLAGLGGEGWQNEKIYFGLMRKPCFF
jgi:hypothetical protein